MRRNFLSGDAPAHLDKLPPPPHPAAAHAPRGIILEILDPFRRHLTSALMENKLCGRTRKVAFRENEISPL